MEKDIDEVGKIARNVKGKLEAISKDVIPWSIVSKSASFFWGSLPSLRLLTLHYFQNISNRQKPGCEKGTGVDRARMNMTKSGTSANI